MSHVLSDVFSHVMSQDKSYVKSHSFMSHSYSLSFFIVLWVGRYLVMFSAYIVTGRGLDPQDLTRRGLAE